MSDRSAERVVVIGAGLAGLSAATHLRLNGYEVDVFEAAPRPGGGVMPWWLPLLLSSIRSFFMTSSVSLAAVRKRHHSLATLPDTIVLPARGETYARSFSKPLIDASLDDVAFAVRGVEAEFDAVSDRLYALKKLYRLARDAGAVGADTAVEAVANAPEKR